MLYVEIAKGDSSLRLKNDFLSDFADHNAVAADFTTSTVLPGSIIIAGRQLRRSRNRRIGPCRRALAAWRLRLSAYQFVQIDQEFAAAMDSRSSARRGQDHVAEDGGMGQHLEHREKTPRSPRRSRQRTLHSAPVSSMPRCAQQKLVAEISDR